MSETATAEVTTPSTIETAVSAAQTPAFLAPDAPTSDGDEQATQETEDGRIKRANAQAQRYRMELREAQQTQEKALGELEAFKNSIAKALGLKPDDEQPDPAALAQQIAERDARIADLTRRSALTDALHAVQAKPIARAAILGDGVLDTLDLTADDYPAQVAAAVAKYVEENDLKVGQVPAKSGTQHPGGTGGRTNTTPNLDDAVARAFGS
jgi:hypothetical protein